MRRGWAAAAMVGMVACSGAGSVPASETTRLSPSQPSPSSTTPPATAPISPPSTALTSPPSTALTSPPPTARAGVDGAPGIGDELFPTLGNGGYLVDRYELDLEVDPSNGSLQGTARVEATAGEAALASFNLDLDGLEVESVVVDGVPSGWRREGGELTIRPPSVLAAGDRFVTEITYGGIPEPVAGAITFGGGWQRENDLVYVIGEPEGASSWFPVNDHPLDPAAFLISLTVPDGFDAVVSGIPVSGHDDPAAPDVWEIPEQTAPYLVALAVGRFERRHQGSVEGVDLTIWYPEGFPEQALSPFAQHAEMISFYSDRFGPYPFDRYGALIVDDQDLAAALETQTLPTYGLGALAEEVVAHELVHQWYGNAVRLARWRDIWLSEGFATFGQWLWVEESAGVDSYDFEVAQAYQIMSGAVFLEGDPEQAAERARRAFYPPAEPVAADLFNPSVYLRAGLTLVALRDHIGDDAMWNLMGEWYGRWTGSAVTTDDFVALVDELHGAEAVAMVLSHLHDPLPPAMPSRDLEPVS